MVILKADQLRVKALLTETIALLCKNGLSYKREFTIEGLIGITLDEEEVFLVNLKETVKPGNSEILPSTVSDKVQIEAKKTLKGRHKRFSGVKSAANIAAARLSGTTNDIGLHRNTMPANTTFGASKLAASNSMEPDIALASDDDNKTSSSIDQTLSIKAETYDWEQEFEDNIMPEKGDGDLRDIPIHDDALYAGGTHRDYLSTSASEDNLRQCKQVMFSTVRKSGRENLKRSRDHPRPFECEVCHRWFAARHVVQRHIENVHEKKFNVYCKICNKGQQDIWHLRRHMAQKHEAQIRLAADDGHSNRETTADSFSRSGSAIDQSVRQDESNTS